MVPMFLVQGSHLRTTNPGDLGTSQYSPYLNRAAFWLLCLLKPRFGVPTVTLTIVLLEGPPLVPWFLIFLVARDFPRKSGFKNHESHFHRKMHTHTEFYLHFVGVEFRPISRTAESLLGNDGLHL